MLKRHVILIAKAGLDGHDRGALSVARALRDHGFQVHYTGIRRTPEQIAAAAVAVAADCVGISSLSGAHLTTIPQTAAALEAAGWKGLLIAGGIIPEEDEPALRDAGVRAVFRPHTRTADLVSFLRSALQHGNHGALPGNDVG